MGASIRTRAEERWRQVELREEMYQGEYIKDIAERYLNENEISQETQLASREKDIEQYGVDYLLREIKKDLEDFGVKFDVWSHQSKIATLRKMEEALTLFKQKNLVFEHEGALWFKSTAFGDDKDRVIRKSDGSYTYLTPDIVYHKDKFERGFNRVINIWGPDHHGYIPRIKAVVQALGYKLESIEVLIVQLASIFKNGEPLLMSTRRGQFISLRDVLTEVGKDAARFFFLMRRIAAHLDFDLELAKKETPENPVYYIQYAHARIHSILKRAGETGMAFKNSDLSLLTAKEELDLMKVVGYFPEIVRLCGNQRDPYPLVDYLQNLAACFHKFYDRHRVLDSGNHDLASERLALIKAVRISLANGLRLLGLSTPEVM